MPLLPVRGSLLYLAPRNSLLMPDEPLGVDTLTEKIVVGFDIETVSPEVPDDEYPDFEDPDDFELLAIALAVQKSGTAPDEVPDQREVLFRKGRDTASEIQIGSELVDWLQAVDPDVIVTFNGDRFDLNVTIGRMERGGERGESIAQTLRQTFDKSTHLDLKHSAWSTYGNYTSLEKLCEHQDLPVNYTYWDDYDFPVPVVEKIVETADEEYITSADVARLGELYLISQDNGNDVTAMEAALRDYALADVGQLFTLAGRHPF
jgi:hypothetical protein